MDTEKVARGCHCGDFISYRFTATRQNEVSTRKGWESRKRREKNRGKKREKKGRQKYTKKRGGGKQKF